MSAQRPLLPKNLPVPAQPSSQFDYYQNSLPPLRNRDNHSPNSTSRPPNGPKTYLPRLVPAAPRMHQTPHQLSIETPCDQQRTGCDQSRLYPKRRKEAPPDPNRIQYLAEQALAFLRQDLDRRVEASNVFPSYLSPTHIRSAMARYEEVIEAATKRAVCASCGRLLHVTDIRDIAKDEAAGFWTVNLTTARNMTTPEA